MEPAVPREKLKELIEKNGDSLFQDRDRCEGLLKDYCGGSRREISAIVGALEERIPVELKSSWQTAMTPEAMRARLVQRLEDNRGLAPEIANYAVDTWSYALGVGLGRSSDRVQEMPLGAPIGVAVPATAAERAAADRPAGSVPGIAYQPVPPPPPPYPSGGLTTQNKAVIGGAGLFVVAALAFALVHHTQQAPPPAPTPNPNPPVPGPVIPGPVPGPVTPDPNKPDAQIAKPDADKVVHHGGESGDTTTKTTSAAVSAGTSVVVRLDSDFNSDNAAVGDVLPGSVVTPLTSNGNVVIPRGATAQLKVARIDKSGKLSGKSHVEFALVSLTARGKVVHITGASKVVDGPSQGARTAERTGIGTAAGAAIGALAGHLFHHAGTGAAAGAGAGGATGAFTGKPAPVKVNAETVLQFRLSKGIPLGS